SLIGGVLPQLALNGVDPGQSRRLPNVACRGMSYDLKTICPLARWCDPTDDKLTYGADDLPPCVVIGDGVEGTPYAWGNKVEYEVFKSNFPSKNPSRAACVTAASFFLDHLRCPGRVHPAPS